MALKLYQIQVLAGVLLTALAEGILIAGHSAFAANNVELLEGSGFLLCCAGVVTGGRDLRSAFDAFSRDKSAAKRDPTYMRARAQLQITSVAAVAAVGLIVARRSNIDVVVPLAASALLGLSLPFVNRASGWGRPD
jgi:hypothetical protein